MSDAAAVEPTRVAVCDGSLLYFERALARPLADRYLAELTAETVARLRREVVVGSVRTAGLRVLMQCAAALGNARCVAGRASLLSG